jgi:hypothetical protein
MQATDVKLAMAALLALGLTPAVMAQAKAPTLIPVDKEAVRVACQVTEFQMQPKAPWRPNGKIDQAVVLKDPAGEQTVLFDTTEGGAIVSYRYRGVEHVWGYNGGAHLQMAFHNRMSRGGVSGDYNPTQAGDGSAPSPVTGVACQGTDSVEIVTMMLDFNHNEGFYENALMAVWGGLVNKMTPLSYFAPYTLETRAHWVPNPAGEPKYYLQLDERFTHLTDEKIGPFSYDFASYQLWEFNVPALSPENCPCTATSSNHVAGGWYRDEERTVGLAVGMPTANFPDSQMRGGHNHGYMWRNRSFHLNARGSLDGIASKSFVWYAMVGPWKNAVEFSRRLGTSGQRQ